MLTKLILQFFFTYLIAICVINCEYRRYDGYSVLRLTPTTRSQLEYLQHLAQTEVEIDFWTYPSNLNSTVDVMLSPQQKFNFEKIFSDKNINKQMLIQDVEMINKNQRLSAQNKSMNARFFTSYPSLDEIFAYIQTIQSQNSDIVEVVNIGSSTENRDLRLLKVGEFDHIREDHPHDKPIFFINAGIAGREWVSITTALYFVQCLIDGYQQNNEDVHELLEFYDFYMLPVANPDSYEYSRTNERLWRKTRAANSGSTCIGTDANRNFDHQWNTVGSSTNPCSELYAEQSAANQPETKAISDYLSGDYNVWMKVYVSLQSYGQQLLYPWGYTSSQTTDNADLLSRAQTAITALTSNYNTQYSIGTINYVTTPISGNSVDWAYGESNIKYSYDFVLRDTGSYGFLLPANQIIETGIETCSAVIALAKSIKPELTAK